MEIYDKLVPGTLYEPLSEESVRCTACAHRCTIASGNHGICFVRKNRDGILLVPGGFVAGLQSDPIEKKPFFHILPGSQTFSFGMLGCNLHCSYCQNWFSSQTLRDPQAAGRVYEITAEEIVRAAKHAGSEGITSTYNEPLITAEWAFEVFSIAKREGLLTSIVSNGYATAEVIDFLSEHLDACKIDLKSFNQKTYQQFGGVVERVKETIQYLRSKKIWIEIVTLLVPDLNNSDNELKDIASFVASVSPDIPWHITAYHPDYKMIDHRMTAARDLIHAADIGVQEGLRYVYTGNLPGKTGKYENTYCPRCKFELVERHGYSQPINRILHGACPSCGSVIPGLYKQPLS